MAYYSIEYVLFGGTDDTVHIVMDNRRLIMMKHVYDVFDCCFHNCAQDVLYYREYMLFRGILCMAYALSGKN